MRANRLSNTRVEAIKAPADGTLEVFEGSLPGLSLRITAAGRKTWHMLYRIKGTDQRRRLSLGLYPVVDTDKARQRYMVAMLEADEGRDPTALPAFRPSPRRRLRAVKLKAAAVGAPDVVATIEDLVNFFLAKASLPAASAAEYNRTLRRELLGQDKAGKAIDGVARATTWADWMLDDSHRDLHQAVAALRQKMIDAGKRTKAKHFTIYVRTMFRFADAMGIMRNPLREFTGLGEANSRSRWLSGEEIVTLWHGLDHLPHNMRALIRFILATGQRPGECRGLPLAELQADGDWLLPEARAKNGREHLIPLTPLAKACLAEARPHGKHVFASEVTGEAYSKQAVSKAIARLFTRGRCFAGGERFTPHDLRRTCMSHMQDLNVIEEDRKMIANHWEGVHAVYSRAQQRSKKLAGLTTWADYLGGLIGAPAPAAGNVVKLRA